MALDTSERAFLNFESSNSALWRRVLTMSMFLLWRYLPDRYRRLDITVEEAPFFNLYLLLALNFTFDSVRGWKHCVLIGKLTPYHQH
ncbi:hypothetical protein T08_3471 [Trichinella sp. T8]|nr:hypothetical protein T08_3471 [Trichinella sp. T8]